MSTRTIEARAGSQGEATDGGGTRRLLVGALLLAALLVPPAGAEAAAPGNVEVFDNPPSQVCVS